MAADSTLPTWPEVTARALDHLHAARVAMADARDELNSDLRGGASLTDAQADARHEVLKIVGEVKDLIDRAKGLLHDA